MRIFPVSIERIIANNRVTDAVFRKSWSQRDYFWQFMFILAVIIAMIIVGPSKRLLILPLWIYGIACIIATIIYIVIDIMDNQKAEESEEELIEYILNENPAENNIYSHDEIMDKLLHPHMAQMKTAHAVLDETEI